MREDEWLPVGPHRFIDCWCGHTEEVRPDGRTLDFDIDRVHRWVNTGCPPGCSRQSRVHGHVHVHCPECARNAAADTCCTPRR